VGNSKETIGLLSAYLLATIICISGCSPSDRELAVPRSALREPAREQGSGNRPIRVVATYSILGDWVQNIGGDEIELTVLVGAEGDAHIYEPTPRDSASLAEADILFENGMGFEVWLERLFQASNSTARRVVVTESITPRELGVSESRTEIDPHVWHLPENAKCMVAAIASALEKADPAHAAKYRERQKAYAEQLSELDAWITQQAVSIPAERRKLVTTHDTFGYRRSANSIAAAGQPNAGSPKRGIGVAVAPSRKMRSTNY